MTDRRSGSDPDAATVAVRLETDCLCDLNRGRISRQNIVAESRDCIYTVYDGLHQIDCRDLSCTAQSDQMRYELRLGVDDSW